MVGEGCERHGAKCPDYAVVRKNEVKLNCYFITSQNLKHEANSISQNEHLIFAMAIFSFEIISFFLFWILHTCQEVRVLLSTNSCSVHLPLNKRNSVPLGMFNGSIEWQIVLYIFYNTGITTNFGLFLTAHCIYNYCFALRDVGFTLLGFSALELPGRGKLLYRKGILAVLGWSDWLV